MVIVGGGPAGSHAASQLAAGGASVALLDGSHPREKPCGGGVTARALALVGASVAGLADAVVIETARFEHGQRTTTMPLGAGDRLLRLAVLPRQTFDAELLQRARDAGATVLPSRAVDVARSNGIWQIATRSEPLRARWLIGADGPGSLVRRTMSAPFERRDLSIAAGYYVHGTSSRQIDVAFVDDPPGYLWSFPRPGHLAVGICAQADVTTSARLLALCGQWIDTHVTGGRRERYGWPIPSLTEAALWREAPAGDGWMLAGDAAGLVDPITREGIFYALLSGELAAQSLLAGGDSGRRYVARLRDSVYPELIAAARLKARFYRPQFTGLLISAIERSGSIRAIMGDLVAGEQPYHSLRERLLRTLEWRLMAELLWRR